MKFDVYWDTRIEANPVVCEHNPGLMNFAYSEAMRLYEVMMSDYAALEARHAALSEAVAWERECNLVRHYVIFEALETCALREITRSISAARAEVDALIGEY